MSIRTRHISPSILATLMLATLAGCGGGSNPPPPDPLAAFKQQKLAWHACDPAAVGGDSEDVASLGDALQCAHMRAPLDYANPQRGEVQVALSRAAAAKPEQRAGAILFNPGGPGGDGLDLAPKFGVLLRAANPDDPTGRLLRTMGDRYDMIGFSPRGLGASTELTCKSTELLAIENDLSFDRSEQNVQNARHNARLQAQACAANSLTSYINTDATARDMDLMREVLGDAKLNYIGYSYGTWLGAWYASLFPERAGRMLLDSSMDVTATFDDAEILQEMGKQRVIDQVLAPYAARHPDRFRLGAAGSDVVAALIALPAPMKKWVVDEIDFNAASGAHQSLFYMRAATGLHELMLRHPDMEPDALKAEIDTYVFIAGAEDAKVKSLAHKLLEKLSEMTPEQREPVVLVPDDAVRIAVACNDTAVRGDESYWLDLGNDHARRYPLTGGQITRNVCLYWGGPSVTRPSLTTAAKASPLLVLQSQYDALTPLEGAQRTVQALPNASMITVQNEYGHGLFPYKDDCVDPQVAAYFVDGKALPRDGQCSGKPLPADLEIVQGKPARSSNTYQDPALAQRMLDSIRRQLRGKTAPSDGNP